MNFALLTHVWVQCRDMRKKLTNLLRLLLRALRNVKLVGAAQIIDAKIPIIKCKVLIGKSPDPCLILSSSPTSASSFVLLFRAGRKLQPIAGINSYRGCRIFFHSQH